MCRKEIGSMSCPLPFPLLDLSLKFQVACYKHSVGIRIICMHCRLLFCNICLSNSEWCHDVDSKTSKMELWTDRSLGSGHTGIWQATGPDFSLRRLPSGGKEGKLGQGETSGW